MRVNPHVEQVPSENFHHVVASKCGGMGPGTRVRLPHCEVHSRFSGWFKNRLHCEACLEAVRVEIAKLKDNVESIASVQQKRIISRRIEYLRRLARLR